MIYLYKAKKLCLIGMVAVSTLISSAVFGQSTTESEAQTFIGTSLYGADGADLKSLIVVDSSDPLNWVVEGRTGSRQRLPASDFRVHKYEDLNNFLSEANDKNITEIEGVISYSEQLVIGTLSYANREEAIYGTLTTIVHSDGLVLKRIRVQDGGFDLETVSALAKERAQKLERITDAKRAAEAANRARNSGVSSPFDSQSIPGALSAGAFTTIGVEPQFISTSFDPEGVSPKYIQVSEGGGWEACWETCWNQKSAEISAAQAAYQSDLSHANLYRTGEIILCTAGFTALPWAALLCVGLSQVMYIEAVNEAQDNLDDAITAVTLWIEETCMPATCPDCV